MENNIRIPWPGWEMVKLIGQGGFGAVYEIRRIVGGSEEHAAMKVISIPQNPSDIEELYTEGLDQQTVTDRYESYKDSVIKEYITMATLKSHPHVVYCDDYQQIQHADGIGWDIYIRMELLTPMTKVFNGADAEEAAIKLGKDLSSALKACRKHHILHRDIKPQNIFVSEQGDFKLGDFGIAKVAEGTTGGTKIGTYKYMAPEVYNNQPYSEKADQYSLGMVMYWMLNERRLPFLPTPSTQSQEEEARRRRMSGEALPAPKHGSPALKQIVLRACAYDPKERFATMDDMLVELEAVADRTIGKDWKMPVPPKPPVPPMPKPDPVPGPYDGGVTDRPTDGPIFPPTPPKPHPPVNSSFCPNCGKPLPAGAAFCPSCAHSLKPQKNNKTLLILSIVAGCLAIALIVLLATGVLSGGNQSEPSVDAPVTTPVTTPEPGGEEVETTPPPTPEVELTEEEKLLQHLKDAAGANATVNVWECLDYNGDGKAEAFAVVNASVSTDEFFNKPIYSNCWLWYVNDAGAQQLKYLTSCDDARPVYSGNQYFFLADTHTAEDRPVAPDTGYLFGVRNNSAYETNISGAYNDQFFQYLPDRNLLCTYEAPLASDPHMYIYYVWNYNAAEDRFEGHLSEESVEPYLQIMLMQETSQNIVGWEYQDFNGDGELEAFALTSSGMDSDVWLVTLDDGALLIDYETDYEDVWMECYQSGNRAFAIFSYNTGGTMGYWSKIYSLQPDGSWYRLNIDSQYGLYCDDSTPYLCAIEENISAHAEVFKFGHYFEYDESSDSFVEVGTFDVDY